MITKQTVAAIALLSLLHQSSEAMDLPNASPKETSSITSVEQHCIPLEKTAFRTNFLQTGDHFFKTQIEPMLPMIRMMGMEGDLELNRFGFITENYTLAENGIVVHEKDFVSCNKRLQYSTCHLDAFPRNKGEKRNYFYSIGKDDKCPHFDTMDKSNHNFIPCSSQLEWPLLNTPTCFTYAFQNEPWIHEISTRLTDDTHGFFSNPIGFLADKGYTIVDASLTGKYLADGADKAYTRVVPFLENDIVYYLDSKKKFTHAGIYQADGTVLSKFSIGCVYKHFLEVAPYDSEYFLVFRKV